MLAFNSMTKVLGIFKRISYFLALPFLSGVLVGTSYIPLIGWALLFCYTPLWFRVLQLNDENKKFSQIFLVSWFTQFILTLIGFNWIYYVSSEFGHLPAVLSAAALFAYAAFMHLYIPLSITLGVLLIRKLNIEAPLIRFMILALSMSLIERIWPSIFEWNLGYALLWMKNPIYQWADVVGFWGLSTWIFITQAFVSYGIYLFIKKDRKAAALIVAQTLAVITMLTIVGFYKGKTWKKTDEVVKIAVAQGNIGNAEKLQSEKKWQYHAYVLSTYAKITSDHLVNNPADFVIWPETAMPMALDKKFLVGRDQRMLLENIRNWQIPLVTGGYSITKKENGNELYRNTVFYLSPDPNDNFVAEPYYKTNLLAFGEYMPMGEMFPFLYKLLPFVGEYAKGSGPVVADVTLKDKTLRLGPQICYDSLAPGFSRDLSRNGAQVIFNVTNDAWFGWWAEPYQHQFMTLARAIEVRRPLVRSTNTGFSSAILADGTLLENSPINKVWAHTYEVAYKKNPPITIYTKFGYFDWVIWLGLLTGLLVIYRKKGDHV